MTDDYLWDRSGEPDSEIQQLETALAKFRYQGKPPVFAEVEQSVAAKPSVLRALRLPQLTALAVAAAILLIAASGIAIWLLKQVPDVRTGWEVARLAGTPKVGSRTIGKDGKAASLTVGEMLETDAQSRAAISADGVGEINVEPKTRVRLLRASLGRQRLALDRGTIHVTIWAPPGQFVVDTPSARAIDLGCAYSLQVDDSGSGFVRATMGWVGFKFRDRESLIPAGAVCATRPKLGPGTPYFEDAPDSLRAALSAFDFGVGTPEEQAAQLDLILEQARKQDALTLWHLLSRVSAAQRERVYERLAALVPTPPAATREGILRLNPVMLDSWWNELGYGDISLWRSFERSWSQSEPRAP